MRHETSNDTQEIGCVEQLLSWAVIEIKINKKEEKNWPQNAKSDQSESSIVSLV